MEQILIDRSTEYKGDHDGKSQTASAVDQDRYAEPANEPAPEMEHPSHEEIAVRAHELWLERGCPDCGAEQDWLDAERELQSAAQSRSLVAQVHATAGSVQR